MYKEERDVLEEEVREIDECDMEEFGALDRREKTIAILGDRWWTQVTKQEGTQRLAKSCYVIYGNNVMSARLLEVSPVGVGTVLRLERDG